MLAKHNDDKGKAKKNNLTVNQDVQSCYNTYLREIAKNPAVSLLQIAEFLKSLHSMPRAPNIHPHPVAFPTEIDRANWSDSLPPGDAINRHTYSSWWCAPKFRKHTWVALFTTWTASYIGDPDWDNQPWHVWGAAAIGSQKGRGKYIIIWDCDPRSPYTPVGSQHRTKQPKEFMLGTQIKLLNFLHQ